MIFFDFLSVVDFTMKKYIAFGFIALLGAFILFVAFIAIKTYRDKVKYESESLPSLVEAGFSDFEEADEENGDGISAFDFTDDEDNTSAFQDDSMNSILADANRTSQLENNKNKPKQNIGLFKRSKH